MTKWFVTVDKACCYPDDPEEHVWTLSRDPNDTGWETDSGYSGYGLLKRDAEELANAANRIEDLEAEVLGWQKLGNELTESMSKAVDDCVRATKLAMEKHQQVEDLRAICNRQHELMAAMSLQIDELAELAGVIVKPIKN